mmetsp:Transcript_17016/g.34788  ORF Transcript_17016/g.34788 Transcript_17016/m.34788 type:complete len:244 (+) Transcript_17016:655-1386(+)
MLQQQQQRLGRANAGILVRREEQADDELGRLLGADPRVAGRSTGWANAALHVAAPRRYVGPAVDTLDGLQPHADALSRNTRRRDGTAEYAYEALPLASHRPPDESARDGRGQGDPSGRCVLNPILVRHEVGQEVPSASIVGAQYRVAHQVQHDSVEHDAPERCHRIRNSPTLLRRAWQGSAHSIADGSSQGIACFRAGSPAVGVPRRGESASSQHEAMQICAEVHVEMAEGLGETKICRRLLR